MGIHLYFDIKGNLKFLHVHVFPCCKKKQITMKSIYTCVNVLASSSSCYLSTKVTIELHLACRKPEEQYPENTQLITQTCLYMQYTAIFKDCKNDNFQMKKRRFFSYLCSKHRQSMFESKNKKLMYTPVNSYFII